MRRSLDKYLRKDALSHNYDNNSNKFAKTMIEGHHKTAQPGEIDFNKILSNHPDVNPSMFVKSHLPNSRMSIALGSDMFSRVEEYEVQNGDTLT